MLRRADRIPPNREIVNVTRKTELNRRTRWAGLCLVAVMMATAIGCGGPSAEDRIAAANDTNIKRLASLYAMYQLRNNFQGPANEEEFKNFIREQDPDRLKMAGIDVSDIDSLFKSERDGEPFKIRYGVNTRVRGPALPVIFESTGVDGKRQVGFTNGPLREVDATEYDQLWSGQMDDVEEGGRSQ